MPLSQRINSPLPHYHIRHFDCHQNPLAHFPALTHIHEAICEPAHRLPRHMHATFELVYIVSGAGIWSVEGQDYALRAGDLFLIQPGEVHYGFANPNDPYTTLIVGFDPASLPVAGTSHDTSEWTRAHASQAEARFSRHKAYGIQIWDIPQGRVYHAGEQVQVFTNVTGTSCRVLPAAYGVETILRRILKELETQDAEETAMLKVLSVQALLIELLVYIARRQIALRAITLSSPRVASPDFCVWLTHRLSTPPTLTEMAARVGLSPSHFSVVFKQDTGLTPLGYLNHLRVDAAAARLSGELRTSITQIAMDLGFNSSQYFSLIFHKYKGRTPTQWRRGI